MENLGLNNYVPNLPWEIFKCVFNYGHEFTSDLHIHQANNKKKQSKNLSEFCPWFEWSNEGLMLMKAQMIEEIFADLKCS